jgi:hypothetical protein
VDESILDIGMPASGNGGSECGPSIAKYVEATLHNVLGECDDDWPRSMDMEDPTTWCSLENQRERWYDWPDNSVTNIAFHC